MHSIKRIRLNCVASRNEEEKRSEKSQSSFFVLFVLCRCVFVETRTKRPVLNIKNNRESSESNRNFLHMEEPCVSTAVTSSKFVFPKLVFGTSALGNLFEDIGYAAKKDIIAVIIGTDYSQYGEVLQPWCFDCAGKYGGV